QGGAPWAGKGAHWDRVDPAAYGALGRMYEGMPQNIKEGFTVDSAFRGFEQQAGIRREHEARPGGVRRHPAAQAGHSAHQTGRAFDFNQSSSDARNWVMRHGPEYGFKTNFIKNDPHHMVYGTSGHPPVYAGPGKQDAIGAIAKAPIIGPIAQGMGAR